MLTYLSTEKKEPKGLFLLNGHPKKLDIITGQDVLFLLMNPGFQQAWDNLYENCPWSTVFQSRVFVTTWYKIYKDEYLPILVKSEQNGELIGLMTLALHSPIKKKSGIVSKIKKVGGAGHFEAEYQTWLQRDPTDIKFISGAFQALLKKFPGHHIAFRYIPTKVPLEWIKNSKKWSKNSIIQPFQRPLVNLMDPEVSKQARHSHFRNKLNRLKRMGEVAFERIVDKDDFALILNELTVLYDFRQGAMFNKTQFKEDPLKKELLLAQFEDNILHVTVLKVNKKIFAAIVAVISKNWIHLGGINCHSPYNSRFYSPGFMHFALLGNHLANEGFECFDLTPGYDGYKEQFATSHDVVHELIIGGDIIFRIKRNIRKKIHNALVRSGRRPMTIELSIKKRIYLLKRRGIKKSLIAFLHSRKKADQKIYSINIENLDPGNSLLLELDNLNDLLQYDQQKTAVSSWEFLSKAMSNFEEEKHCITWCDTERLLGCAWLSNSEAEPVLNEFFLHSSKQNEALIFLLSVINRVKSFTSADKLQIIIDASDLTTIKMLDLLKSSNQ